MNLVRGFHQFWSQPIKISSKKLEIALKGQTQSVNGLAFFPEKKANGQIKISPNW